MCKIDINSREDIYLLVSSFYSKVRKDNLLGPVFNNIIEDWESHLEHLTTFWESSLFMSRKLETKYQGNPLQVHIDVDKASNSKITQTHFGIWLQYWLQTIDELFTGEIAENAKRRAQKMSTFMYMKIFEDRTKKNL
ncbi:group III truncated hemoglobin [Lacinutrix sp. 5H-3-7-4]|uniref:group III truncated hemoglobin n=1 Tax=Lacinutrix sp. (strain 5H-3-7-4) TaxID=983544 RepID=UPI00020A3B4B|nr:group III truncated hemoglobin [Lacinutrix sp. 5H-3-7-4]AEH02028.1 sec-independent protein translocase protein TatC [Lacinutrix sp. 5H-3-7-4]